MALDVPRVLSLLLPLLVGLPLAGCGRTPAATDYFPLAGGRHWTYTQTTERDDGQREEKALRLDNLGAETLADETTWHRHSDDGMHYWLRSDDSGIFRVASRFDLDEFYAPDTPHRYVLKTPFSVGTSWQADTVPYLLERAQQFPPEIRHSHPAVPMNYRIEAVDEAVETPAGHFEHCLRVQGSADLHLYLDAVSGWKDLPLLTREWYCPGVGLVRLSREEHTASSFVTGGSLTLELQQWQ
ncbi:MAG: hypothetical protein JOY84_13595 [Curvibacter sp.]|nr:hypothetical protein [Curvibacter sp.]